MGMKQFLVKVRDSKKRVVVYAEYFRVDQGNLVFRLTANGRDGEYPIHVHTFARDYWLDVQTHGDQPS